MFVFYTHYSQFSATEGRLLRVAVGSFFDHLILVVDTLREFDGPTSIKMEH